LYRVFAELMADQFWMRKALEAAHQSAQMGEVPVGAVIIKNETVLAVAHNQREQTKDPTAHAELIAIRTAALATGDWRLTDTTLYVTLEPCPMCAGAILLARIPRVVYAASDPKSGAAGTLFNLLQDERLNHQVDIVEGVLAEESRKLLQSFFRERRS
jgi:tRNA(adenine34) deaminase